MTKSSDDPEWRAEAEYVERLIGRGADAQKRGDYATAERLFREACARDDSPFQRIHLARLYDAAGRDRDAVAEYRNVLYVDPKRGVSTMQEDPRLLARYGDLCAKLGDRREALAAYTSAVERCGYGGTHLDPKIEARNDSFDAVRAAAHLAWAMESGSVGDTDIQTRELEAAEKADPANWMVRFYRARELARADRRDDAQREADLALHLAPSAAREVVQTMMGVKGLQGGKVTPPQESGARGRALGILTQSLSSTLSSLNPFLLGTAGGLMRRGPTERREGARPQRPPGDAAFVPILALYWSTNGSASNGRVAKTSRPSRGAGAYTEDDRAPRPVKSLG